MIGDEDCDDDGDVDDNWCLTIDDTWLMKMNGLWRWFVFDDDGWLVMMMMSIDYGANGGGDTGRWW